MIIFVFPCILYTLLLIVLTGPADIWLTQLFANLPPKSLLRTWDSLFHGCIAAISWLIVIALCPELAVQFHGYLQLHPYPVVVSSIGNAMVSFIISTCVDLDHIFPDLVSLLLKKNTQQWHRGMFHYSLPVIVSTFFVLLYVLLGFHRLMPTFSAEVPRDYSALSPQLVTALRNTPVNVVNISMLLLVSILSHHIRDGVHHGLWLQPLGRTEPLSHLQYCMATVVLPLLVAAMGRLICQQGNQEVAVVGSQHASLMLDA